MLPEKFIENLRAALGKERADSVLKALDTPASVSVRMNPAKFPKVFTAGSTAYPADGSLPLGSPVSWADHAYQLIDRPSFTLDPLFQAGTYYVQEASSMAIAAFEKYLPTEGRIRALDLCAAPGGKSTHIQSLLRRRKDDSFLVSNEVIRSRASILAENMTRWGAVNVAVTNNDPADFKAFGNYFDLLVVDAPCSGEGMFRKDPKAREEWSPENVELCAARQRRILSDIWHVLRPGGISVYSTCTFNHLENEENVAWICSELGAEELESRHFYPSEVEAGEGFFMAILRKSGDEAPAETANLEKKFKLPKISAGILPTSPYLNGDFEYLMKGEWLKAYPKNLLGDFLCVEKNLRCIHSGVLCASVKGEGRRTVLIPETALALCEALNEDAFPSVDLYGAGEEDPAFRAKTFIRKEALEFPDAPLGYLLLKYRGIAMGFVKNLGRRSNNLWPTNWRVLK